jgi:stringent starvation protein B
MTSNKPYLIRAIYEWISDNEMSPYIIVDTSIPEVEVPTEFIKDDKIVLNISPMATHNLRIGNDALECDAKFNGISRYIYIPIETILTIYAAETQMGMSFPTEKITAEEPPAQEIPKKKKDNVLPFSP